MNLNTKYKFDLKGWFNESWRHMLASKGIKSKKYQYVKLGKRKFESIYSYPDNENVFIGNLPKSDPEEATYMLNRLETGQAIDKEVPGTYKQYRTNLVIPRYFKDEGKIGFPSEVRQSKEWRREIIEHPILQRKLMEQKDELTKLRANARQRSWRRSERARVSDLERRKRRDYGAGNYDRFSP